MLRMVGPYHCQEKVHIQQMPQRGAKRVWIVAGPDSWKLSDRIFECFLIYRVVQDSDMVLPTFFIPILRGTL
jgi:hypothetical protein